MGGQRPLSRPPGARWDWKSKPQGITEVPGNEEPAASSHDNHEEIPEPLHGSPYLKHTWLLRYIYVEALHICHRVTSTLPDDTNTTDTILVLTRLATLSKAAVEGDRIRTNSLALGLHRGQTGVPGVQAVLTLRHTEQAPSKCPSHPHLCLLHPFIDSAVALTNCLPSEALGKANKS